MKPTYSHFIRWPPSTWWRGADPRLHRAARYARATKTQAGPKPPQEPSEKPEKKRTIRIGTQLVNVLFSVQDKQNRYLNELKKEDIEIRKRPAAEIFAFKRELDLPLTMAILVDVSASEQYTLPLLKDAGSPLVDRSCVRARTTVGVVNSRRSDGDAEPDPPTRRACARRSKRLPTLRPRRRASSAARRRPSNGGSRQGYTSLWDSVVATCVDMLAKEPGRKTIILLTDGVDSRVI